MTKRTRAFSQYTLPAEVDPATSRCFVIRVPDDPFHVAAFRGALGNLASAYYWADDAEHTARLVAAKWQEVISGMEDCLEINIRLKPTDFCTLQLTTDGGLSWSDVADLSDCANAAVTSGIDDAINSGRLAPGGQPGPSSPPAVTECMDFDVQLSAKDQWQLPFPVSTGDTIEITGAEGGWYDGGINAVWYCADGRHYLLGTCGDVVPAESGDPFPSGAHMQLVGLTDGTPDYYDAYNTTITIPVLISNQRFFLQANDSSLDDNRGTIHFHVHYCRAAVEVFLHTFDFTGGSDEGWHAWTALPGQGAQSPQGWGVVPGGSTGDDYAYFWIDVPDGGRDLIEVAVQLTTAIDGTLGRVALEFNTHSYVDDASQDGRTGTYFGLAGQDGVTTIFIGCEKGGASDIWAGVGSVVVEGIGTDPF